MAVPFQARTTVQVRPASELVEYWYCLAAAPPVGVAVNATAVPKNCGLVVGTEASASAVTGAGTTTL